MGHFRRKRPRHKVRCLLCTPRGDTKETARIRAWERAKKGADQ